MSRRILPARRGSTTFTMLWQGTKFEVSLGTFPDDGCAAEVFISATKPGSQVQSIGRDAAILLSLALQHGVPLGLIRHAISRDEQERPQSIVGAVVDAFAEAVP